MGESFWMAGMGDVLFLDPRQVLYTQTFVKPHFEDGREIGALIEALAGDEGYEATEIPELRLGDLVGDRSEATTTGSKLMPYHCCVAGCLGTELLSLCALCNHAVCHNHRRVGRHHNLRWWQSPCHQDFGPGILDP